MKEESAHRRRRVYAVGQAAKINAPLSQLLHQNDKMPHASTEPIEFPDHQRVSLRQDTEYLFEPRPLRGLSAYLIFKNQFTSCAIERISL